MGSRPLYFTALAATHKVSTIRRRAVAIAQAHKEHGLDSPTSHKICREVLTGIANQKGTAPRRKSALTLELLKDALLAIGGETLKSKRDRALLLVGFYAARRRAELAALDVTDVRFEKRGAVLTIRRSKTDQQGAGTEVALPTLPVRALCPVKALKAWIEGAHLDRGPLFRTFALDGNLQDR